jgi:predicted phage-related endonuclease
MSASHIVAVNRPGERGWIAPGSEQHRAMMSPSKAAAVLGFSRWQSPYGLWMEMSGRVEPDPPKDIFDTGHDAEPYMAARWRRLNPGWLLSPDEVQFVIDPEHFGFPAVVTLDRRAVRGRARRVVQCKLARDLDDARVWGDDLAGDGDAPPDYATQVFTEMLFSGFTKFDGHLMVAGPFWAEKCYPIRYDRSTAAGLIAELRRFWESLQAKTPPPLDDSVATYQTVRKEHPDIAAGTTIDLPAGLAASYLEALAEQKEVDRLVRGIKSEVLDAMGDAETAVCGPIKVAKRTPHASGTVALTAARKTTGADIRNVSAQPEGMLA